MLDLISFNPGWFLTKEGILITVGVILLLIALILLLTSGKKDAKESKKDEVVEQPKSDTQNVETPVVVPNTVVQQPEQIVVPTMDQVQNISNEPVVKNEEPKLEIFEPVANSQVPTQTVEQQPVINSNTVVNEPVMNTSPVLEINSEPVVENAAPNTTQTVETIEEAKPAVSIYGGVSPKTDLYKTEQQAKPVIYGGADPLENTSPMPKVDSAMLYNEPVKHEDTRIIEPIQDVTVPNQAAVMDNSVVDTIPASPVIEPVIEKPTTSPLFAETPSTPVQANVEQPVSDEIETLDF